MLASSVKGAGREAVDGHAFRAVAVEDVVPDDCRAGGVRTAVGIHHLVGRNGVPDVANLHFKSIRARSPLAVL